MFGIIVLMNTPAARWRGRCLEAWRVLRHWPWRDTFRTLHPTKREYTWYSRSKRGGRELNGFRLDHVFVSAALAIGIVDAEHVHRVRGLVKKGEIRHGLVLAAFHFLELSGSDAAGGGTEVPGRGEGPASSH